MFISFKFRFLFKKIESGFALRSINERLFAELDTSQSVAYGKCPGTDLTGEWSIHIQM